MQTAQNTVPARAEFIATPWRDLVSEYGCTMREARESYPRADVEQEWIIALLEAARASEYIPVATMRSWARFMNAHDKCEGWHGVERMTRHYIPAMSWLTVAIRDGFPRKQS